MDISCVACGRLTTKEQPFYCDACFIPAPPYQDGEHIGTNAGMCPSCNSPLIKSPQCGNCGFQVTLANPPIATPLPDSYLIREKNRQQLANDVMADSRMTDQVIEMLGLQHLPRSQQGVALTALAREKMHFLSVEYDFTEAHTLVDLGHAIVEQEAEPWAMQIAQMRLASIYLRTGIPQQAVQILSEQYAIALSSSTMEELRRLEILAYLSLAHRLAGSPTLAQQAADLAHQEALRLYQDMEQTITNLLQQGSNKSEFLGVDEAGATFPRVDYIFTILAILTEEAIARGGEGTRKVQDHVIDMMLELNNLVRIMGQLTPVDDPGYFASHLRDFVRLANGMLWYPETLLQNAGTRRRLFVDEVFQRIMQWNEIIPTHYWLPLRPARFIEAFLRAESWSEVVSVESLVQRIWERTSDHEKANWHYVLADAFSKIPATLGKAINHLEVILSDGADYIKHADEGVKAIAQQLYNSMRLENVGILVGNAKPVPLLDSNTVKVLLDEEPFQITFYRWVSGPALAVFPEAIATKFFESPAITQVDKYAYDHPVWPSRTATTGESHRDVMVVATTIDQLPLFLLFEGDNQYDEQGILVDQGPLYLYGLSTDLEMEYQDVQNLLIELVTTDQSQIATIYSLKA